MSFEEYKSTVSQVQWSESDLKAVKAFFEKLSVEDSLSSESVQRILDETVQVTALGRGKVFKPIRLACTGLSSGPHLPDCIAILGIGEILSRLSSLIQNV